MGDDKKDDGELWNTVEAQTAFLGPNLWDKSYENDLKVSGFCYVPELCDQHLLPRLVRRFGRVSVRKWGVHGRFG